MKFCDCGNILMHIVTAADAYFECTVCHKKRALDDGDTLIKPPAIKPVGIDKVAHIVKHMAKKNLFRTVDDKPCPKCAYKFAKVLMDVEVWYQCMAPGCENVYQ
jgi:DNA-directed RNA polymerase subunit M/transcription elongation factor TFIIS